MNKTRFIPLLLWVGMSLHAADRILVFTKTAGVREDSIVQSRTALKTFFEGKGLLVDTSENAGLFTDTGLAKYKVVVFLKTTGTFLTAAQQTAFENYFQLGNGAIIVHAALDAETGWVFYGKLIGGAYFKNLGGDLHTHQSILIEDTTDISTRSLPRPWARTDEIYNFQSNPRSATNPAVHVLVKVDGSSYTGGVAGADHPMSWYDTYLGGRAWVTAMGHTNACYSDSLFLGHLWGGMQYALNKVPSPIAFPGLEAKKAFHPGDEPVYQATGRKCEGGPTALGKQPANAKPLTAH